MSSEWKTLLLGDVYEYCSGLSKPRSEFGSGHPFLGFKDVFYNSAVPKVLNELVRSTQQEQNRCSIKRGDLFLTRTSETMDELGMSSVALKDYPNATFNGFTKRLRPKSSDVIAPEYARYYFRSTHFRQSVNAMSTMSTRASLNNEILDRLQVVLPPLKEQKCIGYLLATLDDKIELNRKTNETLEAMAKALFKSWFVDFDPVRAKAEGRPTGLPADISDLFPDSFEDSELGEIPSGWDVQSAGKQYDVSIGKTPPRKESQWFSTSKVDMPWLSIRDLGEVGVYADRTSERLTREAVEKFNVKIVPPDTAVLSFKLTIGRVAITGSEMLTNEAIAHFSSPTKGVGSEYTYCLLSQYDYHSLGSTSSIATAVNSQILRDMPLVVPPETVTRAFCDTAAPIFSSIKCGQQETHCLSNFRDALLPKLISGEIRIPDAEKMLEEVGV